MSGLGNIAYSGCMHDRYGCGRANLSVVLGSAGDMSVYLKDGFIISGDFLSALFSAFASADRLTFDNMKILLTPSTAKYSLISYLSAAGTTAIKLINGCEIDALDPSKQCSVLHSATDNTAWNDGFGDILSDGTNVFGSNIVMAWNNARTSSWGINDWTANIPGGSTDRQQSLYWGTDPVTTLRRWWLYDEAPINPGVFSSGGGMGLSMRMGM